MTQVKVLNTADTTPIEVSKVLYTGRVHVTGGRDGYAKSEDGRLQTGLTSPGAKGTGTNPEQLFAAGWSACFIGAMKHNAVRLGVQLPEEVSVDTEVDLATAEEGFLLQARLQVNLPGLIEEQAQMLVEAAHLTCPYSKATRGNINVSIYVTV
ncbi:peroxiredoxin, Ohr subfamily [Filimonas lacunae]|uniref:Peroxiredoxin, Ohr subfamily n=1 Tax=Filimonas lacunae TaxID=477680 RepID=A0A173MIK9_9BACT|nr:organic hydroperoxide resistance protein [Filimonas lacunae]BAV07306.1 organic hydroperoxide resistance protein [Filimonas lacunae]SIS91651.1 peroxiredoxin, Ohr subfamily [Filimonas lacunae]